MMAKSSTEIVLDIKPYDQTTNLGELAEKVFKTVCFEGLSWNSDYTISPIAFGLKKLVVKGTISGNLVNIDDLMDEINYMKGSDDSDIVHSVDLASFRRI
ncbi:unnamed protein product [Blepharisma stoltei]|uniref:Translation elongation factor EF1B beta/delta subunit guanine nucleotide exchange domain-containing protein n=1 Tax=Blepharisma stoltei TaxID=1481888 RepID=A0AAU9JR94_9CILI|nr:unnamed protein product [Blepharisma stoltei]